MAIPLMLIVLVIVAYGTVVESKYNAEYASLVVYKSVGFSVLLVLLWLNIFFATLSRYPFKKHHLGFVITHVGLLTLLLGGFVTTHLGIDGQISVIEGESNSLVVLSPLELFFQKEGEDFPRKIIFEKSLSEKGSSFFSEQNKIYKNFFSIQNYFPFAQIEKLYRDQGEKNAGEVEFAVSFILKSNFFNVSEWLHTADIPELKMGPATLKIKKVDDFFTKVNKQEVNSRISRLAKNKGLESKKSPSMKLLLRDKVTRDSQIVNLLQLKQAPFSYKDIKIELVGLFKNAIVMDNRLVESKKMGSNPAIELKIHTKKGFFREVCYLRFKGFSLIKEESFPYEFEYLIENENSEIQTLPVGHPKISEQESTGSSNVVEFLTSKNSPGKVKIRLLKNNELVLEEIRQEGESLQTPWMGMQIFIGSIVKNASSQVQIHKLNPEKRTQLPPSALKIVTIDNQEVWFLEGEEKKVDLQGQPYLFYYGRQSFELPFVIRLRQFSKIDYPGTMTPMSFESRVDILNKEQKEKLNNITISMNQPLSIDGFTVYQSSYILDENKNPVSIFSVNKDPGRWIKYLGSVILSVGIIIFTLMRSKWYRQRNQRSSL
ncbi:MAG: cytochrome c biogenesis protein ResB [Bdellovibrionaceae bacterium]|nr:cytochrome c biogenesis protein ResB [Pseudobdellovibrionaceae bacterium]